MKRSRTPERAATIETNSPVVKKRFLSFAELSGIGFDELSCGPIVVVSFDQPLVVENSCCVSFEPVVVGRAVSFSVVGMDAVEVI